MSRFTLSFTLVFSLGLVGFALTRGVEVGAGPADAGRPPAVYGFPDPRGIVLLYRAGRTPGCAASRFRVDAPELVLWDDGAVVYRTSTYDYRQGKVDAGRARYWRRLYEREARREFGDGCGEFQKSASGEFTALEGRRDEPAICFRGLSTFGGTHGNGCRPCRAFQPVARLGWELAAYAKEGDAPLTDLAVEVHLERRSCGCRDFPQIAAASKAWPLGEPGPAVICRDYGGRVTLRDPRQVRALAEAVERSAAVIEGRELYTCFLKPVLELSGGRELARSGARGIGLK